VEARLEMEESILKQNEFEKLLENEWEEQINPVTGELEPVPVENEKLYKNG